MKYLNYIVRILEQYKQEAKHIRMIVIYTADIEQAEDEFHAGCLTLRLEQAYLRKVDSKSIRDVFIKQNQIMDVHLWNTSRIGAGMLRFFCALKRCSFRT